jgi:ABC-type multidrug transport system permease subunit
VHDFLHLLKSDWRRLTKTPSVPLLWLAFPILLSLVEYAAFGQLGKSSTGLPKGTLLVVDRDRSTVSGGLQAMLQREPMTDFFTMVKVDTMPVADRRLLDNEGTASLLIPPQLEDSLLSGGAMELVLTPNPREMIRPAMVDAALSTFFEIVNRFLHESDAALGRLGGLQGRDSEPPREEIMSLAGEFYDASRRFEKLGRLRDLELKVIRPTPKPGGALQSGGSNFNFFAFFLPGLTLMSAFFVAQGFERRNFRTRLAGMARRVSASPVQPVTIFAAESASILLAVLLAALLLLAFGALLFHIPLQQPGLLALTLLGFGLFAVGLLKTLYGGSRNLRTAETVGSVVIMLSMMLGGAFAPVEIYAEGMRQIAVRSPVGCASSAMVDALVHGKSLAEAAPHVLGIWIWAVALCGTGILFSRRSHARA